MIRNERDVSNVTNMSTIDQLINAMLEDAKMKDMMENEQLGIMNANQHMIDKSP